jgi:hypothetical protein
VVLLLFAALFTLVFVLNNLVQVLRRRPIGFLGLWLAFLAVLISVVILIYNEWFDDPETGIRQAVLVLGLITTLVNLLFLAVEWSRRSLQQSRAGMGVGVGLLIVAASYSVPFTSAYLADAPESTVEPNDAVRADEPQFEITPTLPVLVTNTSAPTPTMTRTPRPTLTPTNTRQPFGRPTATPTATLAATGCDARVTANLRLRAEPSTNAQTLLTIPFDVRIAIFARVSDSAWWLVEYDGVTGWVSSEFLELGAACADVPAAS